jgi:hypothetical protein
MAAPRRNSIFLGMALLCLAVFVGWIGGSDLVTLRQGLAAEDALLIVRTGRMAALPCALGLLMLSAILFRSPDGKAKKGTSFLFAVAFGFVLLALLVPVVARPVSAWLLEQRGYAECSPAEGGRLFTAIWVREGMAACPANPGDVGAGQ